ncbi:pentapeptide repeat-containing protein [Streptomyces sp. NPDC051211]|uniref:pentapeptide repeat-containing protein n=1 Tax=Streptomyces sp. NPDC051211 TaxID=3154643 RepID=UPI00344D1EF9
MPDTGPWSWALIGVLLVLGVLGAVGAALAWKMAVREPESEPRIEVLAAIGGGLVTGIAIGLSALFLEHSLGESQKYASWRANIEIAQSIPGFTPGTRNIDGINFSGKELHNADLHNIDLQEFRFREADLRGADLKGAKLQRAELIGANLYQATVLGADLRGALLHGANLTHAELGTAHSFIGAKVNAYTCWPKGVPLQVLAGVVLQPHWDEVTGRMLGPREDMKDGFVGGEQAPNCTLWKGGEEIR